MILMNMVANFVCIQLFVIFAGFQLLLPIASYHLATCACYVDN